MNITLKNKLKTQKRQPCPQCTSSYLWYCPHCFLPIDHQLPPTRLPLPLCLIKHPRELRGKSTALHAKLICPEDVQWVESDGEIENLSFLNDFDPKTTLLLFPSPVNPVILFL
jgi:hypothetical protein